MFLNFILFIFLYSRFLFVICFILIIPSVDERKEKLECSSRAGVGAVTLEKRHLFL